MAALVSKPGQHGTLYKYRIHVRPEGPGDPFTTSVHWGYDQEHAIERFYGSFYAPDEAESVEILKIERVRA